jgi:hypothetical protein
MKRAKKGTPGIPCLCNREAIDEQNNNDARSDSDLQIDWRGARRGE